MAVLIYNKANDCSENICVEIICTHQNADFDAVASMLAAHKLYPSAIPLLPTRLNRNVEEFLALYRNGLSFIYSHDFVSKTISRLILTDTQHIPDLRGIDKTPTLIMDHHPLKRSLQAHETWMGDITGAATTLLIEQIQAKSISLTTLEATLLALGIYEDTGNMTYGTTTARDVRAAAWLIEHGAALDSLRRYLVHPLADDQQRLLEHLLKNADSRNLHGYSITVATATVDAYVEGINGVAHRLRDMLETHAVFVLARMPESLQLVCRSSEDAIDTGEVARLFGGGGHSRAAAAAIHENSLEDVVTKLWAYLAENVKPVTRVAELMSFGAHTLLADQPIGDVIHQIRRIGHEGYPVVEKSRVAGLLTRRDADRAVEHGLSRLLVRDIMIAGEITLSPNDAVSMLEQVMVDSGWGQIPVVDEGRIIGIVTRTDLIKHWARLHPTQAIAHPTIDARQVVDVLGEAMMTLINTIARHAQENHLTLYMVGGCVRDLLLNGPNFDVDFVVEGSAIQFADSLASVYGGRIHTYPPFGTAKWVLDEKVASALGLTAIDLPHHIDFAAARNEFYEHPTALPTVYSSSIKLDLQRRDFTINTLAIQLSPPASLWRILDFYGGQHDLKQRLIRVLHSLSFVDDPTRILRAVRFGERLQFVIEPRTAELLSTGIPMLRRITGERVKNELDLILHEQKPENALLKLEAIGALAGIHGDFTVTPDIKRTFKSARTQQAEWWPPLDDMADLYWHLIMGALPAVHIPMIGERLLIGHPTIASFVSVAHLWEQREVLNHPRQMPSQVVYLLEPATDLALITVWVLFEDEQARYAIREYLTRWRHIRPQTDGHALKAMGLRPGPAFKVILNKLRDAWLDGMIHDEAGEQAHLQVMLKEVTHDRD